MGFYRSDKPDPANIAGASEAGVWADIETLGIRKLVSNAAKFGKSVDIEVPIFDAAGVKTGSKSVTYDFRGSSDADATREEMEFGAEAADFMTKTMLEVQQKYGKDLPEATSTGVLQPRLRRCRLVMPGSECVSNAWRMPHHS